MTEADSGETFLQRQKRLKAEREALERGVVAWARNEDAQSALIDAGNTRAQRWVQTKVTAQLEELATREAGDRNDFLNNVAYSMGRFVPKWLDYSEIGNQLYTAARACGLEHDESVATIKSGLTAGMDEPRDPPVAEDVIIDSATGEVMTDGETPEATKPTRHEQMVANELAMLRAREEARRAYEEERSAALFRVPPSRPTLREELLLPDEPAQYAIAELLPVGGNALLTAQYKTGKTTLIGDYVVSHADGTPFLDRFAVTPAPGRVAVWNYELSPDQYRRWLRELNITHPDRVAVLHARGFRIDLRTKKGQDWAVEWLETREVSFWIPDPFARAAVGTKENDNTEVGEWLDTLDIIKERAGVRDLILPTHTGRAEMEQGQERARGATRLDDWADVRWLLTKDKEEVRYFRATGRDVEFGETKLTYDQSTRRLHCGGGDRRWEKDRQDDAAVLSYVQRTPGTKSTDIAAGLSMNKGDADRARGRLVGRKEIVEIKGKGTAKHYFDRGAVPLEGFVTGE